LRAGAASRLGGEQRGIDFELRDRRRGDGEADLSFLRLVGNSAGIDAVRIALARITAGQSDITLVGGAHNAERKDMLMLYEFGGYAWEGEFRPVWERDPDGGFASGSLGAFLVLEAREHAQARGASPIARLSTVVSERSDRSAGAVTASLQKMWQQIAGGVDSAKAAIISGATGAEPATREERAFLSDHAELAVRASGTHIGHAPEPQFAMNLAIAALAVSKGHLFSACDDSGFERTMRTTVPMPSRPCTMRETMAHRRTRPKFCQ